MKTQGYVKLGCPWDAKNSRPAPMPEDSTDRSTGCPMREAMATGQTPNIMLSTRSKEH